MKRKRYGIDGCKETGWCVIDYKDNPHGMVCMTGERCSLTKKAAQAEAKRLNERERKPTP